MIAGTALTVISTVVLVIMRWRGRHLAAGFAKVAASWGFIWVAMAVGAPAAGAYGRWILLGLALGWIGDVFLLSRNSQRLFLAGLISFLAGHLAYVAAMVTYGVTPALAGAGLTLSLVGGAGFYRHVAGELRGPMRWGVPAYMAVISVMLAAGLGTAGRSAGLLLVPGSMLFYASDIGVALDRFKPKRVPAYVWSLPLYYSGQLCFAWSAGLAA